MDFPPLNLRLNPSDEMPKLSDQDFERFQKFIHTTTGIFLAPTKRLLVTGRLTKRLRHLNISSFKDYFNFIFQPNHKNELQIAIDLITTNETHFFREAKHFEFLEKVLKQQVPSGMALQSGHALRVWSAACSSGEEPYTLAMVLAECAPFFKRNWEIVATDLSTRVLEQAARGHYRMERAKDIPTHLLHKYCLKGVRKQKGTFLIDKSLRQKVKFAHANLNHPEQLTTLGEFDVIFLRNVMIYFDPDTKMRVVNSLVKQLKVGGFFFIGHSETLTGFTKNLKSVMPTVYQKTAD